MATRWFDHFASLVTVRDVIRPVIEFHADAPIDDAEKKLLDRDTALVVDDGGAIGWVSQATMDGTETSLRDTARPIDPTNLIEASSSLLVAVEAFAELRGRW